MNEIAPLSTLTKIPLDRGNARPLISLVLAALAGVRLYGEGLGYVICAGGRYERYGYMTCRWIREHLRDPAPIELWVGSDEAVPTWPLEGVVYRQADVPGGWPLKARAVRLSSFERVLFLDSDSLPMCKAVVVAAKAKVGAIFFPDVWQHRKNGWGFAVLGLSDGYVPEMEAGQFFLDRVRYGQAVLLTDYFNQHPEFWYAIHHGDKDLWAMAFARLGLPFETGRPCEDMGWGLRHWLPDGTLMADHIMRIKEGRLYGAEVLEYLHDWERLYGAGA